MSRQGSAVPSGPDLVLLQLHLVATAVLAGMVWVVQLVVYPAFRSVGPTASWHAYHRRHTTAMATVIALPWAVQGLTVGLLLLRRPGPLVLLTAALAAVTVLSPSPCRCRCTPGWDRRTTTTSRAG
jgi:hypothetical protein